MSVHERADGSGRTGLLTRNRLGRAVDRPGFWWSAAAIFFVNALLSAAEGRWVLAVLQALTCLWAFVAGVTARLASPSSRTSSGASPAPTGSHYRSS
jgi:hypothetical protein